MSKRTGTGTINMVLAIGGTCLLLLGTPATAQQNSATGPAPTLDRVHATRLTGSVRIDGVLDESAWAGVPYGGLVQLEPDNGQPPAHQTDWWITYDDEAIYAAFRMHDSAPDSIGRDIGRRDAYLGTDQIVIEFDTYNDDRNGYSFAITAGGAIYDATMYNDGWDDPSWDGVWDAVARVDELGWVAEMRIPLSQLRFIDQAEQVWGVNVSRRVKRNHGRYELYCKAREEAGHISRFPDLVGLHDIHSGSHREVLAYGVSKGKYLQAETGDPFNDGSEYTLDAGADLQWGLSSNFTLNATINPDFGQVEVDPSVVNLSDVETFFEEKRPFFVKDSSYFRYGRDGTNNNWNFNWMDPLLFYSRRIGRAPQLGVEGDEDFCTTPQGTTILGAAKLTGKIGDFSIGGLSALTAREYHDVAHAGREFEQLAEPLANYTVLRARRTSPDARHAVGAIFTSTQRDLSDAQSRETLLRHAYTGGVDGWVFLDDEEVWAMRGYLSGSLVQGDPAAVDAVQTSSRRYLDRPDADHLHYDPERTSLGGWSSRVMLNKQSGDVTFNGAIGASSPGFETNDLGFQFRSDLINSHVAVGRRWTEPNRFLRSRGVTLAGYSTWDFGGTRNGGGAGLFFWANLANYWSVDGKVFFNPECDDTRRTRGGPAMRRARYQEYDLSLSTDSRRLVSAWIGGWYGRNEIDYQGANGDLGVTIKPSSAIRISVSPGYYWEQEPTQWVDSIEDAAMSATYGKRYIFSDFEYRELSMSTRVDWTFTPRLTLQGFIQPLLAVGDYTRLKEFAKPGTSGFNVYGSDNGSTITFDEEAGEYQIDPGDGGDPFTIDEPDFNYKSLRLNMVLRWEFHPGSSFYLVWARDATNSDHAGDFAMRRDLGDLMSADSDDIFLIKVTRWFDF